MFDVFNPVTADFCKMEFSFVELGAVHYQSPGKHRKRDSQLYRGLVDFVDLRVGLSLYSKG